MRQSEQRAETRRVADRHVQLVATSPTGAGLVDCRVQDVAAHTMRVSGWSSEVGDTVAAVVAGDRLVLCRVVRATSDGCALQVVDPSALREGLPAAFGLGE